MQPIIAPGTTSGPNPYIIIALLAGAAISYLWTRNRWRREHGKDGGTLPAGTVGNVLAKYTEDLTARAERKELDAVIGRDEEIRRVMHILSRRTKNNPLLLGEPGVGKTAIVEGIARQIVAGDVPDAIKGKRVLALDLGALIGGTKYRGEFEERMKKLTEEIRAEARRVILFIDEVHMVEQAKGAEGAINVSDILKPALARGELQMIGATTWREFEMYIKTDDALNRRLQPVIVGEPSVDAALAILRGLKQTYEAYHRVVYDEAALQAAVSLAKEKIRDRYLPDKAIDLIDEAGARASIEASHDAKHALGLLHAAGVEKQAKLQTVDRRIATLREELGHVTRLAEDIRHDPELDEIRLRLSHVVEAAEHVRQELDTGAGDRLPVVTATDIQDIVDDWVGAAPANPR